MLHIVIENAIANFEDVKSEIINGVKDTYRAERGGANGHSVNWFAEGDIPLTSSAIKNIAWQHVNKYSKGIEVDFSAISFEYQFIEYNKPNDQYNWHIDGVASNNGSKSRRMTIALNLTSKNDDFIGEGFQLSTVKGLMDNENLARVHASNYSPALTPHELDILSNKNSVVIFNPDTIHRGSPISSGKRQLLTVWVNW